MESVDLISYLSLGIMLFISLPVPLFRTKADVTTFLFVESLFDLLLLLFVAAAIFIRCRFYRRLAQ